MPGQEIERATEFYSDGSIEILNVEPEFCEHCQIEHSVAIRLMVDCGVGFIVPAIFLESCCIAEFIKDGANVLFVTFPNWERPIIFNTTHERDHCYNIFVDTFGNR